VLLNATLDRVEGYVSLANECSSLESKCSSHLSLENIIIIASAVAASVVDEWLAPPEAHF
jgi:hypothetical protein